MCLDTLPRKHAFKELQVAIVQKEQPMVSIIIMLVFEKLITIISSSVLATFSGRQRLRAGLGQVCFDSEIDWKQWYKGSHWDQ